MAVLRNTGTTSRVVGTSALKPAGSPIPPQRRRRHLVLVPGGTDTPQVLPWRSDVVSRPSHLVGEGLVPETADLRLTRRGQRVLTFLAASVVGVTFAIVLGLLAMSGLLVDPAADTVPQLRGPAPAGISEPGR